MKNSLLDLGGVVLDIDYHITARAFEKLSGQNFNDIYSQAAQIKAFSDFEVGAIQPGEFRDALRNLLNLDACDQQIDQAWNAMILEFDPNRIDFLKNLSKHYNLYLFSNTNAIHAEDFKLKWQKHEPLSTFDELFNKPVLSHEIGLRKPYAASFETVCAHLNIQPAETFFIDDTIRHVEGAGNAGLKAMFKPADIALEDYLKSFY